MSDKITIGELQITFNPNLDVEIPMNNAGQTEKINLAQVSDLIVKDGKFQAEPIRFEGSFDSGSSMFEIFDHGTDYCAFPNATMFGDGEVMGTYWRGIAHSPNRVHPTLTNLKGNIEYVISKDGFASFDEPKVVYGNYTGGDDDEYTYYSALGVDKKHRPVSIFGVFNGTYVRPKISRFSVTSREFSKAVDMTFTGSGLHEGTLIPFNSIKRLPSGKLLVPFYQGDNNWIGVIDDDTSEIHCDLKLVVNGPNFSEMVVLPVTEKTWIVFMRLDGSVNSIPMYVTRDAGESFQTINDTGLSASGGYRVQDALVFELSGVTHIALFIGLRITVSGQVTTTGGVMLAVARLDEMLETNDPFFVNRHVWEMPEGDNGAPLDSYVGAVYDPSSLCVGVISHEEMTEFSSRIIYATGSIGKMLGGKALETKKIFTPEIVGATTEGVNTYGVQTGFFTYDGDYVDFWLRLQVTTMDSTGNLTLTGFPEPFSENQTFDVDIAKGLVSGIEDLVLNTVSNSTNAQIQERSGLSNLLDSETSGTFDIEVTGRYKYK